MFDVSLMPYVATFELIILVGTFLSAGNCLAKNDKK